MFKILIDFAMKNRNVLINCKRRASLKKKKLSHYQFSCFGDYQDILVKNLGMESSAARKILYSHKSIFGIPLKQMAKQCQLCQELQIDPSTLSQNIELLYWPRWTLRHRVLLLREMGVPYMHAANVSNFLKSISMRVRLFKAFMGIPESANIADNLLQYLPKPPPSVPALKVLDENMSVNDYHKHCLRWFIHWGLNVSEGDEKAVNPILASMEHRSFQLMGNLFDTLHNDIGLTIEQIKQFRCLTVGSSADLSRIITEIKTFGGVDLKKLIQLNPALHAMEHDNVVEVIKLLEHHGFSTKAMRRCPEILLMENSEVAHRLKTLDETPELRVLKDNTAALTLIRKFTVAQIRVEYLRYINVKHTTVRSLTGATDNFERFVRTGVDRTKGKEIGYSFEKSVKLEMKEIRRRIGKHSYWRHVDLVAMHDSLDFLLERFDIEDLRDNLPLILYPREKIAETLDNLPELKEESIKQNLYTTKQILAICLYEMEREHHFTGDGVWKYDAPPPRRLETPPNPIESDLSDFSDSEGNESEEMEESSKNSNETEKSERICRNVVNKNVNT